MSHQDLIKAREVAEAAQAQSTPGSRAATALLAFVWAYIAQVDHERGSTRL